MSVTITLRKCLSEKIRLNKEFVTTDDISLTGEFRSAQDILNPVITIESDNNLSDYNYCEIPDFNRKYFASVKAESYKIWTITLEVDVLSTYATDILNSKAIVKRTEQDNINYYMNDGAFYTEQRQIVTYHNFKKNGNNAKMGTNTYYLLVAGG